MSLPIFQILIFFACFLNVVISLGCYIYKNDSLTTKEISLILNITNTRRSLITQNKTSNLTLNFSEQSCEMNLFRWDVDLTALAEWKVNTYYTSRCSNANHNAAKPKSKWGSQITETIFEHSWENTLNDTWENSLANWSNESAFLDPNIYAIGCASIVYAIHADFNKTLYICEYAPSNMNKGVKREGNTCSLPSCDYSIAYPNVCNCYLNDTNSCLNIYLNGPHNAYFWACGCLFSNSAINICFESFKIITLIFILQIFLFSYI